MKKAIDYGKIISLHNAGWSGDEIAKELQLSREAYNTALTDLLDRLDEKIKPLDRQYRAVMGILMN
ncbi:MAG: hypothetical protein HFI26_16305 [Lachnospiraceae bacterium]|jgi:orotate phosphoribosyltransferase-like protein|nr:hypothetical protein [Lachnospiraceae bacterium]